MATSNGALMSLKDLNFTVVYNPGKTVCLTYFHIFSFTRAIMLLLFVCLFVFLFCHFKLYILSYLCHFIMMSWRHRNVVLNFFRYFFFFLFFFLFAKFYLIRVWQKKKKRDKFDTNSKKVRGQSQRHLVFTKSVKSNFHAF